MRQIFCLILFIAVYQCRRDDTAANEPCVKFKNCPELIQGFFEPYSDALWLSCPGQITDGSFSVSIQPSDSEIWLCAPDCFCITDGWVQFKSDDGPLPSPLGDRLPLDPAQSGCASVTPSAEFWEQYQAQIDLGNHIDLTFAFERNNACK